MPLRIALESGVVVLTMDLFERLDRIAVVAGGDEDALAARERRNDFSGQAENRGLVGL